MKLLNAMFGCGKGGIEQAAYDYHEALALADVDVETLLQPTAQMRAAFDAAAMPTHTLKIRGDWDMLAARALRKHAQACGADGIICHGNRAVSIALKALSGRIPVIGVAHNYKIKKRFPKCDAVFCITRDLIEECVQLDMPRQKLFHLPNMTRLPSSITPRSALRDPVVIGSMGRFVEKKGMDIFLHSLAALRQHNIAFKAKLGGGGALEPLLRQQAAKLGIDDALEFSGWVADKQAFFASLDLFVLPSHHEPFGIVLIEAMAAGLPVITTDTEGPCEIITQHTDAVMVEKAKPYAMAQALRELIEQPEQALAIGRAARQTVAQHYDLPVFSARLKAVLQRLLNAPT